MNQRGVETTGSREYRKNGDLESGRPGFDSMPQQLTKLLSSTIWEELQYLNPQFFIYKIVINKKWVVVRTE